MSEQVPGWLLDRSIGPNARLTQGDLVKFEKEDDPLRRVGIVVTADCDLEQRKHAKLVTLVPLVSPRVILESYLLIEDCEKKRELIERYAFRRFSVDEDQDVDTKRAVLREIVKEVFLEKDDPSRIAAMITLDEFDKITVLDYKSLMKKINIASKKLNALRDQIRGRGDILVLPDPVELGVEGSVAWVRHIWQVPISTIAIKTSEVRAKPGERLARLDSPFRYRLTQMMAQVFSDIGLPDMPDTIDRNLKDIYEND